MSSSNDHSRYLNLDVLLTPVFVRVRAILRDAVFYDMFSAEELGILVVSLESTRDCVNGLLTLARDVLRQKQMLKDGEEMRESLKRTLRLDRDEPHSL